jgi:hypothetical protein
MVSTTVEKALFIVVGLSIFTIVGVPLFNVISNLQHQASAGDMFRDWTRYIEYGIRQVEDDHSKSFEGEFMVLGNVSMIHPDSYTLRIVLDDGDVYLEHEIRSSFYPLNVTYAGPGPERPVNISIYYDNGMIHLIFEEIQ